VTAVEAAKLVAAMIAAFPQARVTPGTSPVYERMLADLDYVAAQAAVERLIATSRFMPTVAELRSTVLDLTHGERRPGGEAWGDVLKAIGRVGKYRTPTFADQSVARAVTALGWENICDSDNQVADRARFIELYDQLATSERKERSAGHLPAAERFRAALAARSATAVGAGEAVGAVLRLVGGKGES
jgi:hypothetical protein